MPMSEENMNDIGQIRSQWSHFIFMQIDNPRWPPWALLKIAQTRMTISQES